MKKSKTKILLVLALMVIMLLSMLPINSLATTSDILVIKENDNQYLIYMNGLLNQNFEFAFSNSEDATNLNYITAVKDNEGNYIAYVDADLKTKFFSSDDTYLWVKNTNDEVVIDGEKITINDAKTIEQLNILENLTKNITINSSAENEKITINGEEGKTYYYKFFVAGTSEEYNRFLTLVEKINDFDKDTNTYTKLQSYIELSELYNNLVANLNEDNWTEAKDLEITKPYDAKEGEKYILWLKDSDENIDVQILTAYETEIKIVEEQQKTEQIVTALPVTYDDTTVLFIALGAVVIAMIAVIAFKKLNKKNRE